MKVTLFRVHNLISSPGTLGFVRTPFFLRRHRFAVGPHTTFAVHSNFFPPPPRTTVNGHVFAPLSSRSRDEVPRSRNVDHGSQQTTTRPGGDDGVCANNGSESFGRGENDENRIRSHLNLEACVSTEKPSPKVAMNLFKSAERPNDACQNVT